MLRIVLLQTRAELKLMGSNYAIHLLQRNDKSPNFEPRSTNKAAQGTGSVNAQGTVEAYSFNHMEYLFRKKGIGNQGISVVISRQMKTWASSPLTNPVDLPRALTIMR